MKDEDATCPTERKPLSINFTKNEQHWHEDLHANAIRTGALITRNECLGSEFLARRLSHKDYSLLLQKLAVLKRQFHLEILEHIDRQLHVGHTLSSQLTTDGRQHLISLLSESLGHQVCRLSLGDLHPEILRIWIEGCSPSSYPHSVSKDASSDASSEGSTESVADAEDSKKEVRAAAKEKASDIAIMYEAIARNDGRPAADEFMSAVVQCLREGRE